APEALRQRDPATDARARDGNRGSVRGARPRPARARRGCVGGGLSLLALGHHLLGYVRGAPQRDRATGARVAPGDVSMTTSSARSRLPLLRYIVLALAGGGALGVTLPMLGTPRFGFFAENGQLTRLTDLPWLMAFARAVWLGGLGSHDASVFSVASHLRMTR